MHLLLKGKYMHYSRRRFLWTSGLGITGLCCGGFKYRFSDTWIPSGELQEQIPQFMKQWGLTHMSMAVFQNGAVWDKQFVTSGADDALTVFEAGSLSKPLAAVLALQLQNQGRFSLDKPLAHYWLPKELEAVDGAQDITARHVLSHASGLQNWRFQAQDRLKLSFKPGAGFSYSGEGYVWLQQVMEHLTGAGYSDLIANQVLKPLGMSNSNFCYDSRIFAKMTPGYQRNNEPGDNYGARIGRAFEQIAKAENQTLSSWNMQKVLSEFQNVEPNLPALPVFVSPNAAGSLASTTEDYIGFIKALMQYDPGIGLSEQDYNQLFMKQSEVSTSISWGLGWGLAQEAARQLVFHTAETRFFKGVAVLDRPAKRALVILTNGANGDRVYDQVCRTVTDLPLDFLQSF